jgi:hypothetical protein
VDRARDEEREERRGDERQRLVAREAAVGGLPQSCRQLRGRLHRRSDRVWKLDPRASSRCRFVVGTWDRGMNCYIRRRGGEAGGGMDGVVLEQVAGWLSLRGRPGRIEDGSQGGELWRPPPGKEDSNQHRREDTQDAAYVLLPYLNCHGGSLFSLFILFEILI